jgi:predicted house-cleaning noncanonical NTP pyrophosphatase (MazG superfamily)
MATSKQEQIYNEIIGYYTYADRLIKVAENSSHELAQQQFAIIEEIAQRLEEYAEQISAQYLEFVKTTDAMEVVDSIRVALNNVAAKIEECRNKVLMLHLRKS